MFNIYIYISKLTEIYMNIKVQVKYIGIEFYFCKK